MARKDGEFLRGLIGPLIFRVINNVQHVSLKIAKGTMKQTKETKKSALTFGMATSLSAEMLASFKEMLKGFNDYSARNRLNSVLNKILDRSRDKKTLAYSFFQESFSKLGGFEFNVNSKLEDFLMESPKVTIDRGKLYFSIPKSGIPARFKFPLKSSRCELKVSLTFFRLTEGLKFWKLNSKSLVILNNHKNFEGCEFVFDVPEGCLCITSMSLDYSRPNGENWLGVNNKSFSPAAICDATVTPGEYQKDDRRNWREMIKFC